MYGTLYFFLNNIKHFIKINLFSIMKRHVIIKQLFY